MSMKPRLPNNSGKIDPNLVSSQNAHPGEEGEVKIENTVSCNYPTTNSKLDPNLVSGPKTS
jgi:hypothetical protein